MNSALIYYAGGQRRRHRLRAEREINMREVQEPLVESDGSIVVGFWVFPSADTAVKLKVCASYTVNGKPYPVSDGPDSFPEWAVVANYNVIKKHIPWLPRVVAPLADGLMAQPHTEKWLEAMKRLAGQLISRGWCSYMHNDGSPVFETKAKGASVNGLFGEEFFNGKHLPPQSIKFDYSLVKSISVSHGRAEKMTRETFAEFLGVKVDPNARQSKIGPGGGKFKYGTLEEFMVDFVKGSIDYKNLDMLRVRDLLAPAPVNVLARTKPNMLQPLATFLSRWFRLCKQNKWTLPYDVRQYTDDVQAAIKVAGGSGQGKKPKAKLTEGIDNDTGLRELSTALTESMLVESRSFANLLASTRTHGRYRVGGLALINGRWVNDITVPGRMENARFVIAAPPLVHIEPDGSVIYRWKFKSRATRSTTGVTHRGYLRVAPKKKGIMAFLKRLIKGDGPWEGDCQVWCSCDDFKYRFHYSNWEAGASHKPTGQNGDSIFSPPVQTNPQRIPMLCKHLICAGTVFLHEPPKKLKDEVSEIQRLATEENPPEQYDPSEPIDPEAEQAEEANRIGREINPTDRIGG